MIMPLGDENRPGARTPIVTWGLIAVNVVVFLIELSIGPPFIYGYSSIPFEITRGEDLIDPPDQADVDREGKPVLKQYPGPKPIYLTLLSSMFMHAGWMHLLGNMLYLWVFGDNLEDNFGHGSFLLYYMICGFAATAVHILMEPASKIPSLGASGAISGIMGGYIVLFPRNAVRVLLFRVITHLPAIIVLGLWIGMQFISFIGSIAVTEQSGGVAYGAHVGGFAAGVIFVFLFRKPVAHATYYEE